MSLSTRFTPSTRFRPRLATRALRMVACTALLLGGLAARARAVSVSPAALYLDSRTRSGMLTLFNPGTLPEEIEINFAFGYPTTDAKGDISVNLVATAPDSEPSLVPYLRAFPRRLRLEPGQRQVIRILVNPPAGLPVGEYWGRITILSSGGRPPIEQTQGGVNMHIELQTQVVAAVSYRNGDVSTGVRVTSAVASQDSAGANLTLDLARQGNAAFLGHIDYELVSPSGQVVTQVGEDVAIYRSMRRVVEIPRPATIPSFTGYTIRFRVAAERPDLPPGSALPAPTVTGSVKLP